MRRLIPILMELKSTPRSGWCFLPARLDRTKTALLNLISKARYASLYRNIEAVLKDADMGLNDLVKLTTYLVSRDDLDDMRRIRKEILGDHKPAHTLLLISGLTFPEFLIEVEGFAAK